LNTRKFGDDHSEREVWDLHVSVDVQSVVLGSQHYGPILHERHIETLGVLDLALKRTQELPGLAEYGQIEVVVVVGDGNFPVGG